jgi:NAD(P)-dependent dehydrogenase (short-subunit alcohol dehydrogenase family)
MMIDVTDADSITAAATAVTEAVGDVGIAGLVNNAGIAVPGPLELIPLEAFRRQLDVNVIGPFAVTQAFLPLLRKARGRIVNMSSQSGCVASPYLGPYCTSKFALEAMSDALRMELRTWGIHVACVEPGPIETPIWKKTLGASDEMLADIPADKTALYKADIAALRRAVDLAIRVASPVSRVVKAVVHALTAKRPKTRYFLGWDTRIYFKGSRYLNDRLRDWIICKVMGLP